MTDAQFVALCELVVKLTDIRAHHVPNLCVENFAPELMEKLIAITENKNGG